MTQQQVKILSKALRDHFDAKVEVEPVNSHGRYRFSVTSRKFEKMAHLRRQDAIWKIVQTSLPRDVTLDISLILAFAPSELATAK